MVHINIHITSRERNNIMFQIERKVKQSTKARKENKKQSNKS